MIHYLPDQMPRIFTRHMSKYISKTLTRKDKQQQPLTFQVGRYCPPLPHNVIFMIQGQKYTTIKMTRVNGMTNTRGYKDKPQKVLFSIATERINSQWDT